MLGGAGGALFWVALRARVGEGLLDDSGAFSKLFAAEGGGTWIAFVAAMPEQSIVAAAAGLSLGRAMGVYESATLLGATIGTFAAGQLYDAGGGWRVACWGAAGVLLLGSILVSGAIRRVGVARFPVEHSKTPENSEKPGQGMSEDGAKSANEVKPGTNNQAKDSNC